MPGTLKDKVAIITGAGRGIGAACAELFVKEGAKVVIASRTEDELRQVEERLGAHAFAVSTDVSDEAAVKHLFVSAAEKFEKIDILINNAGFFLEAEFSEMRASDWDRVININLRGTFLCSREAFRWMKDGGSIVNISSLAGIRGAQKFKGFAAYVAAKAGIVGLTEALAIEGRDLGIRVNCIAPGGVETKMFREALPSKKSEAKPQDIAKLLLGLCDESRSSVLTGAIIEVHTKVI